MPAAIFVVRALWSLSDPAVHQATDQFDDAAALERGGRRRDEATDRRDWPDVTRTRESFTVGEAFPV